MFRPVLSALVLSLLPAISSAAIVFEPVQYQYRDAMHDHPAFYYGGAVYNYLTPGNAIFNNPEAIYTSNPRAVQLTLKLLF